MSISNEVIVAKLQQVATSQEFRKILEKVTMAHCETIKDYQIVIALNQALNKGTGISTQPLSMKKSTRACEEVLAIESLMCQIFTYLDLQSLSNASNVNSQWLHDANNKGSVAYLELIICFIIKGSLKM